MHKIARKTAELPSVNGFASNFPLSNVSQDCVGYQNAMSEILLTYLELAIIRTERFPVFFS